MTISDQRTPERIHAEIVRLDQARTALAAMPGTDSYDTDRAVWRWTLADNLTRTARLWDELAAAAVLDAGLPWFVLDAIAHTVGRADERARCASSATDIVVSGASPAMAQDFDEILAGLAADGAR